VATADAASGFVNTHLRLRYHAKAVYALMGLVLFLVICYMYYIDRQTDR